MRCRPPLNIDTLESLNFSDLEMADCRYLVFKFKNCHISSTVEAITTKIGKMTLHFTPNPTTSKFAFLKFKMADVCYLINLRNKTAISPQTQLSPAFFLLPVNRWALIWCLNERNVRSGDRSAAGSRLHTCRCCDLPVCSSALKRYNTLLRQTSRQTDKHTEKQMVSLFWFT